MGDQEYLLAFSRVLLPIALEFRPELCATAPAHNPHNPRRLVPATQSACPPAIYPAHGHFIMPTGCCLGFDPHAEIAMTLVPDTCRWAHLFVVRLIVAAGFDSGRGDPWGECDVTTQVIGATAHAAHTDCPSTMPALITSVCHVAAPQGFANLTALLMTISCGKMVMVMEGGYNLKTVSHSLSACVSVLRGQMPPPLSYPTKPPNAQAVQVSVIPRSMREIRTVRLHAGPDQLARRQDILAAEAALAPHWKSLPSPEQRVAAVSRQDEQVRPGNGQPPPPPLGPSGPCGPWLTALHPCPAAGAGPAARASPEGRRRCLRDRAGPGDIALYIAAVNTAVLLLLLLRGTSWP